MPAQSYLQNQRRWFECWYHPVQTGLHLPRPRTLLSVLDNRVTNRFVRVQSKKNGMFELHDCGAGIRARRKDRHQACGGASIPDGPRLVWPSQCISRCRGESSSPDRGHAGKADCSAVCKEFFRGTVGECRVWLSIKPRAIFSCVS